MNKTDYEQLKKSRDRLKNQYEFFVANKATLEGNIAEAVKESVVKRFDICFDTLLKHMKKYMEEEVGLPEMSDHAQIIFRNAKKGRIISEDMQRQLHHYREIRNNSAHSYSEEEAQKTIDIVKYFIQDVTELYEQMVEDR